MGGDMAKQIDSRLTPVELLAQLEEEHARLKQECRRIDSQTHLSADEEMALQRLKKEKLRTKDTIQEVRDSIPPPAP